MFGMRIFLFSIFLAAASSVVAQGQAIAPDAARTEFLNQKYWSELGKPTEGTRGFSLFTRDMQPKSDSRFEVWLKILPNNQEAFNKRYGLPRETAYVVQFATVDCKDRSVQLERTSAYNSAYSALDARSSDIVKNESRNRVRAGSVGETVFQYICLKLPN